MNAKILIGFFAGAVLASIGTYWITHRPSSAPIAVEAPPPAQPPAVSPPVTAPLEPPPPPEPVSAPPEVTANRHKGKQR
ncbi:MAG TPA: hypothetical protein VK419_12645, partial [Bryobacteraceae bacterium]|nr:hypothetical protein [Bryobacteraceae bacterium]